MCVCVIFIGGEIVSVCACVQGNHVCHLLNAHAHISCHVTSKESVCAALLSSASLAAKEQGTRKGGVSIFGMQIPMI